MLLQVFCYISIGWESFFAASKLFGQFFFFNFVTINFNEFATGAHSFARLYRRSIAMARRKSRGFQNPKSNHTSSKSRGRDDDYLATNHLVELCEYFYLSLIFQIESRIRLM